jgi:NADH-quinone oxidoreductase subunit A
MTPLAAYVLLFLAFGAAFILVVALLFVIFDVEVAFFFPWAEVFGKATAVATAGPLTDAESYHQTGERAMELVPAFDKGPHKTKADRLQGFTSENVARLAELRAKDKQAKNSNNPGPPLTPGEKGELQTLENVESLALSAQQQGRALAWLAFWEILVFFGVLLVGFAYLWRRGDLAWVRSLSDRQAAVPAPAPVPPPPPPAAERELVGAGNRATVH